MDLIQASVNLLQFHLEAASQPLDQETGALLRSLQVCLSRHLVNEAPAAIAMPRLVSFHIAHSRKTRLDSYIYGRLPLYIR